MIQSEIKTANNTRMAYASWNMSTDSDRLTSFVTVISNSKADVVYSVMI